MVQGKSPEQKRIHGGVHRNFSSDLHQDSSSKVGADLEKKLRSMKISGFDSLQHSPTMDFQFKKTDFSPIRNYMKPTRSSDARKGKLPATVNSPASTDKKNSNSFMAKKNLNRATCSSTLKDFKFPAALVINSEGKSKMRVCPYTYCSLNGHLHELSSSSFSSSSPLKCFISERRRIVRNQRSMDMETLFFSVKIRGNEEEKVERVKYRMPAEEIIGEKYQEQGCVFAESECSRDQLDDVKENLVEYVEVDDEGKAQEDYEFEENRDGKKNSSMDMDCKAEDEESETEHSSLETANFLEYVEVDDEGKAQEDYEFEENRDGKKNSSMDMDCKAGDDSEEEESETEHSSLEYVEVDSEGIAQGDYEFEEKGDGKNEDMDCEAEDDLEEEKSETEHSLPETADLQLSEDETTMNASGSKWNITRKKKTEEFSQAKEFNPKQPNFLPLEPDPEDEKVDLRHQMMDGRRSAEEWMIDYALQHAVTRLGDGARKKKKKKKVALLVEAFETVVPLHTCETPVSHGTSSFTNLSFIQACS